MEIELEPRVKPLAYKVKAMSRESSSAQKASNVLDSDLRTHWSTGTNTKEWILLELDEPCLLSHIRIYNKSVLEWEITVGLRYKPETFVKVRPRCEAPRRDMVYPMNYTPCRYVRISCLRGNPISIFFIKLIGVSVTGLEPEFQPLINNLLPHIILHKQDAHDMHLQLLQDITSRLRPFIPQLEADLASFPDMPEKNLRFLAMLAGPIYPILYVVNEREIVRSSGNVLETEGIRNSQPSPSLTVSSNFEPRRARNTSPNFMPISNSLVFRPDAIFVLLRKAYEDPHFGTICRVVARLLRKFLKPGAIQEASIAQHGLISSFPDEASGNELSNPISFVDYCNLFGEEFKIPDDHWDLSYLNILNVGALEEGIFHLLYACASQPLLCCKLAGSASEFWSALPLVQALLPALRPSVSGHADQLDASFSLWKQPFVHQALSQIVSTVASPLYRPLLHGCAGYLASFAPSHVKAACVLIDLCFGVLAPWMAQVVAKIDLAVELLEDLLGTIQGGCSSLARARAALKYIVLALSGHVDDILTKYKEVKNRILFLVEMLEPFLDPAVTGMKSTIAFGDVSSLYVEKQQRGCVNALNIIRVAVEKPAVLPSLESQWRRGKVAPSVILSILDPHIQLPPELDLCKSSASKCPELDVSAVPSVSCANSNGVASLKPTCHDENEGKVDASDAAPKMETFEDAGLFFAPPELRSIALTKPDTYSDTSESCHNDVSMNEGNMIEENIINQAHIAGSDIDLFNLGADYMQLTNYEDCEHRASEFRQLALDLQSEVDSSAEDREAAIDAFLLAAECYVNPFFMTSARASQNASHMSTRGANFSPKRRTSELKKVSRESHNYLKVVSCLEWERDKLVLQILLEAAELYHKCIKTNREEEHSYDTELGTGKVLNLSSDDTESADAITLVRQNQALLCKFLIRQLLRAPHSMHEILLQSLLFYLHSATKLFCAPEDVIDVILGCAEHLNGVLTSLYSVAKARNSTQLDPEKIHSVQRRWKLLQKLVISSSGAGEGTGLAISAKCGLRFENLVSPTAWIQKIPTFSASAFPLVRFFGWMAVSRNASQYLKEGFVIGPNLSQMTSLLSIFGDELSLIDNIVTEKNMEANIEEAGVMHCLQMSKGLKPFCQNNEDRSFSTVHPDLSKFVPNMKRQFEAFGAIILEAVGSQLKSLSSSYVPDVLCWFSDLCSWPFLQAERSIAPIGFSSYKGHVRKNAKAIVLYILEAIISEHMEAMVPEIPRVVQVLESLCKTAYCDVSFLSSVLRLVKPIISYSLGNVSDEETLLIDDQCLNFESLCFAKLFKHLEDRCEIQDGSPREVHCRALTIYILASVFPDFSFHRKQEFLQALPTLANFVNTEPTASFHDYLSAFQFVMESCESLLLHILKILDVFPLHASQFSFECSGNNPDSSVESDSWPLKGFCQNFLPSELSKQPETTETDFVVFSKKKHLSGEEIKCLTNELENVILNLMPAIELCWNYHQQLARKLTVKAADCYVYSSCLSSIVQKLPRDCSEYLLPENLVEQFDIHWQIGFEALIERILLLQKSHCWEVSSLLLDYLLGVPKYFSLHNVAGKVCSAIRCATYNAPKIAWRLQTDKWLSSLFVRDLYGINGSEAALIDLIRTLIGHSEPEQRYNALQHLQKLVNQDLDKTELLSSKSQDRIVPPQLVNPVCKPIIPLFVSKTWDQVALVASSDSSLLLRTQAMTLLVDYVPFLDQQQLQSFLATTDTLLYGLGNLTHPTCEGPLTRISLALIANACLYSRTEDLSLVPENVWRNIEDMSMPKSGVRVGDLEQNACKALCRLKSEGDDAKEVLKNALSCTGAKEYDPEFGSTRDSVLQVITNLTSTKLYFEVFSSKLDQEALALEEAETEMDIIKKENSPEEPSRNPEEEILVPFSIHGDMKNTNRLQQIKDCIRSMEKSKLREDIVARRQKRLLQRHARQKYLEEAALREAQMLQELDRERTAENEKEFERQRQLEHERSRTKELRHNLDMERERQAQRELQRELEQVESGSRTSRRDFSSHSSRPRERYRDRDNGRLGNEGNLRSASAGLQPDTSNSNPSVANMPPVVLSGPRPFPSGQMPTILQSRDRPDEYGSHYEETLDGSRDSGDTGSTGDPELASAFDGQVGGFGSAQRHGPRGSKSKQAMERRERDNRREGKWERKYS